MLIVNADDWGRSRAETDVAMACHRRGAVGSVSAMVFMEDSERAASIAKEAGVDVGLHVNFSEAFTSNTAGARLREHHGGIVRFLKRSKYAVVLYQPWLRERFRCVYKAQAEEFVRLYGGLPSHIDGHQHMHLCSNMLVDGIIPRGQRVRRSFSFWPGEKGPINRAYRRLVDGWLARRYQLTDYFFALSQCLKGPRLARMLELAKTADVELMTHPKKSEEYDWLSSEAFIGLTRGISTGTHAMLQSH